MNIFLVVFFIASLAGMHCATLYTIRHDVVGFWTDLGLSAMRYLPFPILSVILARCFDMNWDLALWLSVVGGFVVYIVYRAALSLYYKKEE